MPHSIRDAARRWLSGTQMEQVVERSPSTTTRKIVAVFPEGSVIWSTETEAGAVAVQTKETDRMTEEQKQLPPETEAAPPSAVQHHYHYHYLQGTRWLWLCVFIGMVMSLMLAIRIYKPSTSDSSPSGAQASASALRADGQS